MYQIVIVPRDTGATACLYFKGEDDANVCLGTIQDAQKKEDVVLRVKDDFGFIITMDIRNLSYAMLIDVAKSNKLHSGQYSAQAKPSFDVNAAH